MATEWTRGFAMHGGTVFDGEAGPGCACADGTASLPRSNPAALRQGGVGAWAQHRPVITGAWDAVLRVTRAATDVIWAKGNGLKKNSWCEGVMCRSEDGRDWAQPALPRSV